MHGDQDAHDCECYKCKYSPTDTGAPGYREDGAVSSNDTKYEDNIQHDLNHLVLGEPGERDFLASLAGPERYFFPAEFFLLICAAKSGADCATGLAFFGLRGSRLPLRGFLLIFLASSVRTARTFGGRAKKKTRIARVIAAIPLDQRPWPSCTGQADETA